MIQLTRDRSSTAVTSGLRGTKRVKKCLALLKLKRSKGQLESADFKSSRWKPAKPQLLKESHGKCAYCEADTKVVAHGDVEHFRPKTKYWWLAYCYDNFLYSCQICNQTFKSNHFPISGTKLRAPRVTANTTDTRLETLSESICPDPLDQLSLDAFVELHRREKAHLIDPYDTDPEKQLIWIANHESAELSVRIKPRVRNRAAKQQAIDELYGLNREELLKVRYQDFEKAEVLARALDAMDADSQIAEDIREMLRSMMSATHRFAGMIRYFVRKEWELDLD